MKNTKTISNGNKFELRNGDLYLVHGSGEHYIGCTDAPATAQQARDAIIELVGPPAGVPKAPDPSARAKFMAITQPLGTYIDMEFTVLDHWPSAELGTAVKESQGYSDDTIEIWQRVAVIGPRPEAGRTITYDHGVDA